MTPEQFKTFNQRIAELNYAIAFKDQAIREMNHNMCMLKKERDSVEEQLMEGLFGPTDTAFLAAIA